MSTGSGAWRRGPDQDPVAPPGHDNSPRSATTPIRPGSHIIRPMPSSRATSFQDLASKSVAAITEEQSRFEVPSDPTTGGGLSRTLPLRRLIVLALAMIVLGIAGGVSWVTVLDPQGPDTSAPGAVTGSPSSPQEAVLGYLQALADGRVAEALSFGPPTSTENSTVLLDDAIYDTMPAEARPSDIRVLTEDPLATDVRVEYTHSGRVVSTTMLTERQDDGSYALARTTSTMRLLVDGSDNLPVLLNGVRIDPSLPLAVLPGVYVPSTGLPLIDFPDAPPLEIASLASAETIEFAVNPELTTAGRTGFLQAARSSLDRCIALRETAPADCPNVVLPPQEVVPGSVLWTLQDPALVWEMVSPALSPADQSVGTATLSMELMVEMDFADGQGASSEEISLTVPVSATMVGEDAASIKVIWGG